MGAAPARLLCRRGNTGGCCRNGDGDNCQRWRATSPGPSTNGYRYNTEFGPTTGGTSVTITGTGFCTGALGSGDDVTAVDFGLDNPAAFTVDSETSITATSPPGSGRVNVTVTVDCFIASQGTSVNSSADQFTYVVPAPTVAAVDPSSGPAAGGTAVTITGTGFCTDASGDDVTAVDFGSDNPATGVRVHIAGGELSSDWITATSPPGSGTVNVTVTTNGLNCGTESEGTSAVTTADQFTYVTPPVTVPPPPTVTSVVPDSGRVPAAPWSPSAGPASAGPASVRSTSAPPGRAL